MKTIKEKKYKYNGSIHTYSGNMFNPFNPNPDLIFIDDIAQGLSNTCRFGGQISKYYSVAEHSVFVSMLCDEEYALEALLHDAAEAYLGDIPTPIKERLDGFIDIEENLLSVIFKKFNLQYPLRNEIKFADKKALDIELNFVEGNTCILNLKSPQQARDLFMQRFNELTKNKINFI